MSKTVGVLRRLPEMCLIRRAVAVIPHPQKAHRGGEDAFLSHPFAVSVADGVGGYSSLGVDPALFTRNIMAEALAYVRRACGEDDPLLPASKESEDDAEPEVPVLDAVEAVHYGLVNTVNKRIDGGCAVTCLCMSPPQPPSPSAQPPKKQQADQSQQRAGGDSAGVPASTSSPMSTTRQGECSVMNLGDCGTILFRNGHLMFKTIAQQHRFNCPYQLPGDTPRRSGSHARLTVLPGDVVFQASDGVFDNVSEDIILEYLHRVTAGTSTSDVAATEIANLASKLGHDKKFLSPFSLAAQKEGYQGTIGGKLDDVTVLIAVVEETSSSVLEHDAKVKKGASLITDLKFPVGKSAV